jgi:hypothetical protein
VRVTFNNQNFDTTSGSDRKWVQNLPATPASGPHSILVVSFDGSPPPPKKQFSYPTIAV